MRKFELKVDRSDYEMILSGGKTFEVRLGDRKFEKGDVLVLLEKDPIINKLTGRKIIKTVIYTKNTKEIQHWTKEEVEKYGLQIIAFRG